MNVGQAIYRSTDQTRILIKYVQQNNNAVRIFTVSFHCPCYVQEWSVIHVVACSALNRTSAQAQTLACRFSWQLTREYPRITRYASERVDTELWVTLNDHMF